MLAGQRLRCGTGVTAARGLEGARSAGPPPPGRRVVVVPAVAGRPASVLPGAGLVLEGMMGLTRVGWASASPSPL